MEVGRKQAIVGPDHCCGQYLGPCGDIAPLAEHDFGLIAWIGADGGCIIGFEVVEKVCRQIKLSGHHRRECTQRLSHDDGIRGVIDGFSDERRILGQARIWRGSGQVDRECSVTGAP